jgi:hypothetical protein
MLTHQRSQAILTSLDSTDLTLTIPRSHLLCWLRIVTACIVAEYCCIPDERTRVSQLWVHAGLMADRCFRKLNKTDRTTCTGCYCDNVHWLGINTNLEEEFVSVKLPAPTFRKPEWPIHVFHFLTISRKKFVALQI